MTTQKIIKTLKDDNEYYNGIGRQYLSNSDIGTLLKNPRDFGKKLEDSKEFAMGRYFHQLFQGEQSFFHDYYSVLILLHILYTSLYFLKLHL